MTPLFTRNQARRGRPSERGFVSIISAVVFLAIVPMMGMMVDAGSAFVIRARLSAAVDAAALGAARSLNSGSSVSDAQTAAIASATTFFNANFPTGFMGTDSATNLAPTFTLGSSSGTASGILTVSVTGTVNAPTYFVKMLNIPIIPITAVGTATRKNLAMSIVLDISSSMGTRNSAVGSIPSSIDSTSTSCESMVYESIQFLNAFSPYDTVGVVSFDYTAHNIYPPSTNFKASGSGGAAQAIANLQCGNNPNTTAGLELGYRQIKSVNQVLGQNVLVLFTDGSPNGVTANFPVRHSVDTRLGPSNTVSSQSSSSKTACTNQNGQTMCVNMPVTCNNSVSTVYGTLVQWNATNVLSGPRSGLYPAFDGDPAPVFPGNANGGTCPSGNTMEMVDQTIAYIPDTDFFGNSTHSDWDDWIYQTNPGTVDTTKYTITAGNSATKNMGALWSTHASVGAATAIGSAAPSNFFPTGTPYAGKFRPDLLNAITASSMNSAVNEAARIRSDTSYKPVIHTIYLQGNGQDPVDRSFLQIIANKANIDPILYNASGTASYANSQYQASQATGYWLQTTNALELKQQFATIAGSLLRLSN